MSDFARYCAWNVVSLFFSLLSLSCLVVFGVALVAEDWPKCAAWGVSHLIAHRMWKETKADAEKYDTGPASRGAEGDVR